MVLVKMNMLLGQTPMDPMDKADLETDLNQPDIKAWVRENLNHETVEQLHSERHAATPAAST